MTLSISLKFYEGTVLKPFRNRKIVEFCIVIIYLFFIDLSIYFVLQILQFFEIVIVIFGVTLKFRAILGDLKGFLVY